MCYQSQHASPEAILTMLPSWVPVIMMRSFSPEALGQPKICKYCIYSEWTALCVFSTTIMWCWNSEFIHIFLLCVWSEHFTLIVRSTFAVDGKDCKVNAQVERVLRDFHKAGKPIGWAFGLLKWLTSLLSQFRPLYCLFTWIYRSCMSCCVCALCIVSHCHFVIL